ncbi:hypothetical protein MTR67_033133 [Solanum verrucosum]|uniref:Pentatricopeptide repeat-containing protein n=1 Tax=Solanum verrucosum TaxID=315347 RepID=A0AAF0U5S7_SOLVR|nr:hypothetical protein MTR67_033133 [Solanum verrucosum]
MPIFREKTMDENVTLTSNFDGLLQSSYGGDPEMVKYQLSSSSSSPGSSVFDDPHPPPQTPLPPPICPVCKLVYTYGYANCKAGRRCRFICEETTDENVALTEDFDDLLRSSYGGDPKIVIYQLRLFLVAAAEEVKPMNLVLKIFTGCSCRVEDFHKLCSDIMKWDEISWNAIISGFSNFGVAGEAFFCFSRMRRAGFTALQN